LSRSLFAISAKAKNLVVTGILSARAGFAFGARIRAAAGAVVFAHITVAPTVGIGRPGRVASFGGVSFCFCYIVRVVVAAAITRFFNHFLPPF